MPAVPASTRPFLQPMLPISTVTIPSSPITSCLAFPNTSFTDPCGFHSPTFHPTVKGTCNVNIASHPDLGVWFRGIKPNHLAGEPLTIIFSSTQSSKKTNKTPTPLSFILPVPGNHHVALCLCQCSQCRDRLSSEPGSICTLLSSLSSLLSNFTPMMPHAGTSFLSKGHVLSHVL